VELAVADDPFARQSEVDRAVDDAFLSAVRDGADPPPRAGEGDRAKRGGGGGRKRSRLKRAGRPNTPKTFGSRRR
jgi:excinuclease ABC subunit B